MDRNKECIKKIELVDMINDLPDIAELDWNNPFQNEKYDLFICALGFEERCLTISERLNKQKNFKCINSIIFEYVTNIDDNDVNKTRLLSAIESFSISMYSLKCDEDDFKKIFRNHLEQIIQNKEKPKILFDISVCSSKLLISILKILFEYAISLKILYSEAKIYHPTCEEFEDDPEKWMNEEELGIARGVDKIIPSAEFPGVTRELPDLITIFPTFKPERTNAIITYIDESIKLRPEKRTKWIIGKPHMDKDTSKKRMEIIRKINNISEKLQSYEVCTLDYKKTLEVLEKIYNKNHLKSHINISALGSKMQSIGISIFCYIRPDVSIYHALPKEYNPNHYSEGCKKNWIIDFGDLNKTRNILNQIGKIEITKINKCS